MSGRHRLPLRLNGTVSPSLQDIVHAMERPLFGPQDEQRTLNFLVQVRLIVCQIDRCSRTIVFANRMDCFGTTKGAEVFLKYRRRDPFRQWIRDLTTPKPKQSALQKIL